MIVLSGQRVVVRELYESPSEALERGFDVEGAPPIDTGALAPRDVVVRVRSAAVGWVDLLMSSGQYQHMASPPYVPGLESTGEVVWVGAEVTSRRVGDRVIVDGFVAGPRSLGPHQGQGSFQTHLVLPEHALHALPATLTFDQGAALLSAYETAYHCLVARGRLAAGETVLVLGASGSTGLAAVELAKILGATVIAVGRSPEKLAVVSAQGADHVITTNEGTSLRDEVKRLTGGAGVEVVYDAVGGELSHQALRCVRFGARFLIVGWTSTPAVARGKGERGAPNANQLPTNLVMMKQLDVLGCPTAIATAMDPSIRPPRLRAVLAWAEAGKLAPHVSHRFPLAEARAALKAKWSGEVIGNAVLHP
jgi:NADPH2:quinone reductase